MSVQDSSQTILTSARRFFSGTMISRVTGLAREVAMAAAFGTHPTIAAFWMAYRFAHLFRRLFGEGALNTAFIPHFENLRKEEPKRGARFFYDLCMGMTLLLLLMTLIGEGILGGFLLFGHLNPNNASVIRLTMLMLPAIVFISLYALNTSILNCERIYFLPSVAPACLNLIWILAIFLLLGKPNVIDDLAMVIVLAFAMQWLVTLPRVIRFLSNHLGEKWWQESGFAGAEIVRILRPFLLGLIGVGATQINSALDAIFARAAHPEGPAFLWYAIRIQQLPLALFGVGLTGALLPSLSRANPSQIVQFLNFAFRKMISIMLPMMFGIFALGFSGINLVYGHGEFSQAATVKTTECLWAYGLGLIPMAAVLIFASAFYAQKNYRMPTLFSVVAVGLNIALNTLFVFGFHMGAVSVAIATTMTAVINAFALGYFLNIEFYGWKTLFYSFIAAVATLTLGYFLFQDNTMAWLFNQPLNPFPRTLSQQLTIFVSEALCFWGVFLGLALLLGEETFNLILRKKMPE